MSRWFFFFLFYSLGGYGLEKLFARAVHAEKQVRKCFLLLPLCPVYGLAMMALLALVPAGAGFWTTAALGAAVCTAVEYLVHLFYDKVFDAWFWDYRALPGHIRGRVCPQFSLAWGVLSALALQRVQPAAEILAVRTPPEVLLVLWVVLAADCLLTASLLLRFHDTELLTVRAVRAYTRSVSQSNTSR